MNASLQKKIVQKTARVGIIGMGYVGLPLAILTAREGFWVTGFTKTEDKTAKLRRGETSVDTIDKKELTQVLESKKLSPRVLSPKELERQDIIIICVPTPLTWDKKPDLTAITQVATVLRSANLRGKLIINESTVAPGTTKTVFGDLSEFLACSPERVDPGNHERNVGNIAKVVGGINRNSVSLATFFYENILDASVVAVSNLEAAEMAKMLENTYRAVNIGLINEVALLCETLGIDILEVIAAASTKWSFQPHFPGIGVGGHCIPVDPYYLVDLASRKNSPMTVVPAALSRNSNMPRSLFAKLKDVYKKGMKIVVYGLSYKKNIADIRESPVVEFCKLLSAASIPFSVYDPHLKSERITALGFTVAVPQAVDIFVVGTDHSNLKSDHKIFVTNKTVVIDGRNAFVKPVGKMVIGVGRSLA